MGVCLVFKLKIKMKGSPYGAKICCYDRYLSLAVGMCNSAKEGNNRIKAGSSAAEITRAEREKDPDPGAIQKWWARMGGRTLSLSDRAKHLLVPMTSPQLEK